MLLAATATATVTPPATLTEACGANPSAVCRYVWDRTGSVGWAQAADFIVAKPLRIAFILILAYVANRLLRSAINRFTAHLAGDTGQGRLRKVIEAAPSVLAPTSEMSLRAQARARSVGQVLKSIGSVVVYAIATVYILGALGLNLGPLLAGAGIVGIAIGFGAQSLVRDCVAGLFILIEDQYGVGDTIDVGGVSGTVEQITLRATRLRDVQGTVWHLPNGVINRVGNKSQEWARAVLDVNVGYDADVERAEAVIATAARATCAQPALAGLVLEDPEVWGVESLGPDGIALRLVVKTTPGGQWKLLRTLRADVLAALEAAGIELAAAQGIVAPPGTPPAGGAQTTAPAPPAPPTMPSAGGGSHPPK